MWCRSIRVLPYRQFAVPFNLQPPVEHQSWDISLGISRSRTTKLAQKFFLECQPSFTRHGSHNTLRCGDASLLPPTFWKCTSQHKMSTVLSTHVDTCLAISWFLCTPEPCNDMIGCLANLSTSWIMSSLCGSQKKLRKHPQKSPLVMVCH